LAAAKEGKQFTQLALSNGRRTKLAKVFWFIFSKKNYVVLITGKNVRSLAARDAAV
jgi:hypothetical protein